MTKKQTQFYVFDQIIKSEDDLVGLVAYSRYKYKKVKRIKELKEETGKDFIPSDNEALLEFQRAMVSNIQDLRAASRGFLDTVAHKMVEVQMEDFEKCALNAFQKVTVKPNFWVGILQNLIATLIFTAIAALIYYSKINDII